MIRTCPGVEEYLNTGRATFHEARLYLPNGQYIPNDRSNRGLKYAIDTWIAENTMPAPIGAILKELVVHNYPYPHVGHPETRGKILNHKMPSLSAIGGVLNIE